MNELIVGLCQMKVESDKGTNLKKAAAMIAEAVHKGAKLVMLPEVFNGPYAINSFREYAEEIPSGETVQFLAKLAQEYGIYLVGGSIPELGVEGELYNTSVVFNDQGEIIGKHQKIHLFDVHVKGGIQFQESSVLSAGRNITLVNTPWGKLGVIICYDIRFPELTRAMALAGMRILCVPAAFNLTTGPLHWSTLFKSRGLDNEIFVLGNSPARNLEASYHAYGHSLVVNPWGQIIEELDETEGVLVVKLNLDEIDQVREALPVYKQRREEVYHGQEF